MDRITVYKDHFKKNMGIMIDPRYSKEDFRHMMEVIYPIKWIKRMMLSRLTNRLKIRKDPRLFP